MSTHQRGWDERLPLFFLAYRASTHDSIGSTPASLVFGRELRLPCDLLFGAHPDKEGLTTDHAADLVDHLHDIHHYARQHLKLASDRMKIRYDKSANSAGYHEGPTGTKGKSPKLQSSWEGPYKVITRINDVVYTIQRILGVEDDGSTPGPAKTLSGSCSGRLVSVHRGGTEPQESDVMSQNFRRSGDAPTGLRSEQCIVDGQSVAKQRLCKQTSKEPVFYGVRVATVAIQCSVNTFQQNCFLCGPCHGYITRF
jgi:hypothetical protein